MTIAPLNKIYWSDIEEACLEFIKDKCCNIDQINADTDFIYGNSLSFTGYGNATSTMPYHNVTVTFTNDDTVCQVVSLETVRTQLRDFISIHLGSFGSLGFMQVSTYASILNLYSYIAGFISARLVLIRHPFKDSTGYVFYNSSSVNYQYYGSVRVFSTLSSTDILDYLKNTFNNASFGSAYGSSYSANIRARAMLLNMTNECVTVGYPTGYAAYESSVPGTYNITISQAGVYDIHLVGGGGGGYRGAWAEGGHWLWTSAGGGSGAYVHWWQYLTAGAYSVTVGAAGSSSSSYGVSAGNGGNTVFLSQTAGGGIGGHGGGYYPVGGSGGTYSTSYTGINGNSGDTSGMAGTANGGSSVYAGYGAGGNGAPSAGNNGAIVLFYRDAVAPAIFESSIAGTYSVTIPVDGKYEIYIVGGGGGGAFNSSGNSGSQAAGNGGGIVNVTLRLGVGVYTAVVGASGSKAGGLDANAWGGQGGNSYLALGTSTLLLAGGGTGNHCWWRSGAERNSISSVANQINTTVVSTTSNLAGNWGEIAGYGGVDCAGGASRYNGYGKGGNTYNRNSADNGVAGYICIRQLAGID